VGGEDSIAIRTEDLTKRYASGQSEITVFDNLNLEIRSGERVAVMGESGAGKSTLLHLLGGLDRPSGGTVYFGSKAISGLSDGELSEFRNKEIGFVWQSHSLLPEFTAEENVMMPLLIGGVAHSKASRVAVEKLTEVGLRERAHHRAGELSGGEQQRVALARALINSPKVLLADEPTGSLDYRTADGVIGILEDLHRRHQLTSIIVTHNDALAERCDRVLMLKKGRLQPAKEGQPSVTETAPPDGAIGSHNGSTYV
jgi:lipoprotein-releasing system ATP-binding protein